MKIYNFFCQNKLDLNIFFRFIWNSKSLGVSMFYLATRLDKYTMETHRAAFVLFNFLSSPTLHTHKVQEVKQFDVTCYKNMVLLLFSFFISCRSRNNYFQFLYLIFFWQVRCSFISLTSKLYRYILNSQFQTLSIDFLLWKKRI